ncbi:lipase 1 [Paractinoplanes deccanensis]|uniref:Lipase 1 n=1 Tax=Paractinoplanes deccanensis TaxID=113561 RepID=A0ABQ3YJB2_9ACTN|nr:SGNH/GDSL hydrolase family protein [Actinoplanes deccanensis]GID80082.1 lipase 1 [Actinoplanes deccanensis]
MIAVATAVAAAVLAPAAAQAATPGKAYVALGDSYAAGVGAPPYTDPTCLRGTGGYPPLLAGRLGATTFHYDACSGATTADVLATQLGNLDRHTRLVTVTVGGNDLGFSSGLATCLQGTDADCATVVAAAEKFTAETLPGRLDTVYRTIKKRAPHATVVATGYAHFFETTPDCATVPASLTKRTALNSAVDVLDAKIRQRAARAGIRFADVRPAFAGHGLCGNDPWLGGPAAQAPFHPTAGGYSDGYLPAVGRALVGR